MRPTYLRLMATSLKFASLALACAVALPAAYLGYLQLIGNFHVVAEGALYRSAQPSETDLRRYVQEWGIRSVVNLRHNRFDDAEREKAGQLGVSYYQVPLAADRLLTAAEITAAIRVLTDAPKPILVHSQFGADRAGLISALYLLAIGRKSAAESSGQLSPVYGHLPYFGSPTAAMDKTFKAVASLYGS